MCGSLDDVFDSALRYLNSLSLYKHGVISTCRARYAHREKARHDRLSSRGQALFNLTEMYLKPQSLQSY